MSKNKKQRHKQRQDAECRERDLIRLAAAAAAAVEPLDRQAAVVNDEAFRSLRAFQKALRVGEEEETTR